MHSFSSMSFVGMLLDICKVLHSLMCRQLRGCSDCASGCSICMWLFRPPSLGQDPQALLESRVMVQESTSGRVHVYVRIHQSRVEMGPAISILSLCVLRVPCDLTGGVRESMCQLIFILCLPSPRPERMLEKCVCVGNGSV